MSNIARSPDIEKILAKIAQRKTLNEDEYDQLESHINYWEITGLNYENIYKKETSTFKIFIKNLGYVAIALTIILAFAAYHNGNLFRECRDFAEFNLDNEMSWQDYGFEKRPWHLTPQLLQELD